MFRPMVLVLLAGLASAADPPPAKLPKFKDYVALPDPVVGKLKEVDGDTLTLTVVGYTLSGGSRKRPPTLKGKEADYPLTLHPEALVRWSRKRDRTDDKGRGVPYTVAEMKQLMAPPGAPGIVGDPGDLAAGQTVEVTLLVPAKPKPEGLAPEDYRIKWVVIQGAPPDPKAKEEREKKKKKDKK